MSNPLDNLCGPGKQLQKEAPDANELAGFPPKQRTTC